MIAKDCDKFATPKKRLSLRSALGLAARIGLLTTPVWALSFMPVNAAIIFYSPFESGYSEWSDSQLCCSHSAQVVSSPVKFGSNALKITYRKTDYTEKGGSRAELEGDSVPAGSERWYGVSIYIPPSFTTTERGFIITQFHDRPDDGEEGKIPPLFLATDGQNLRLGSRWDARKILTNPRDVQRQDWDLGPLPKGRWVDFVYHVKWSYQSDGILEVFQDGKLVVSKKGPNSYNDDRGPYMKIGMYASSIDDEPEKYDFTERVLYFDEVRIGDASSRYQDVAPRGNGGGSPPSQPQAIRVEAESMFLSAYQIESGNSAASGSALISLRNTTDTTDTASSTFSGTSGKYDVYVGYFDENDGVANLQVSIGGVRLANWQLGQDLGSIQANAQTLVRRKIASGLSINKGARIEIKGTINQSEWARVDYIDFVPVP